MDTIQTTAPTCPHCGDGSAMRGRRAMSEAEHAKIFDREDPRAVPQSADTATAAFIAEHGTLFECRECGYRTRAVIAPAPELAVVGN